MRMDINMGKCAVRVGGGFYRKSEWDGTKRQKYTN